MINYKERAVTGVYWMSFMSAVNVIMKLLITMVLSRLLSSYEFGAIAAVQIVISFAEVFWMMGVGPAIVQKKDLTKEDILTGNTLNIIFGVSIYSLIFIFAPAIASFVGIENIILLKTLAIVFVIHSISGVSESLLQKEMDFKSIGAINTFALFVYGLAATILAYFNFGVWALVFSQILQATGKSIFVLRIKPIKLSFKINMESAKKLLYFGTGFTLSKIFNTIALQGDYFVVNKTLGSHFLGFYNRAYQLLTVPANVIGGVMDQVLFPLLSRYQDEDEKLRYVFVNITSLTALIALPITNVSLVMGREVVNLVLGSHWDDTIMPFKILVIGLFFRMAYKICDSLIRSLGAVYKRLWIQAIYAITVIIGSFIGKEWGINGVAMAVTIAIIINYLLMILLTMYLIKLKVTSLLRNFFPIAVVSCIIGSISVLIVHLMAGVSGELLRLIIITVSICLMYLIAFKFIIIKFLPRDFNEFVTTIISTTLEKLIPAKSKFKGEK